MARSKGGQSRRDAVQGITQAQYARGREVTRQAIRRAIETGRIRPGKGLLRNGRIDPKAADRALRANTDHAKKRGKLGGEPGGATLNEVKTRRETALAAMAELELEQMRGNLVPRAEVRSAADEVARRAKERILGVTERVMDGLEAFGLKDTAGARKLLNDELGLALTSLADDVGTAVPVSASPEKAPAA